MQRDPPTRPEELTRLEGVVVAVMRRVYALNAARYDPLVGDDAFTFATNVWRNGWSAIESALDGDAIWGCARPLGSLQISGEGVRIHVYKCGSDESACLESFRLDYPDASLTKRQIPDENQLVLDLRSADGAPAALRTDVQFTNLVVLHAGNADDGCCGIWVGAPVPVDEGESPWAWLDELWSIDRRAAETRVPATSTPHTELAEPELEVEPIGDAGAGRRRPSHHELAAPDLEVVALGESADFPAAQEP